MDLDENNTSYTEGWKKMTVMTAAISSEMTETKETIKTMFFRC